MPGQVRCDALREMLELIVEGVCAGAGAGAVDEYELRHATLLGRHSGESQYPLPPRGEGRMGAVFSSRWILAYARMTAITSTASSANRRCNPCRPAGCRPGSARRRLRAW